MRSKAYLKHVRQKPCLVCDGAFGDSVAHHLTFIGGGGMALKEGDEWCVPLCTHHHNDLHVSFISEARWWVVEGIDARGSAKDIYEEWKNDV